MAHGPGGRMNRRASKITQIDVDICHQDGEEHQREGGQHEGQEADGLAGALGKAGHDRK